MTKKQGAVKVEELVLLGDEKTVADRSAMIRALTKLGRASLVSEKDSDEKILKALRRELAAKLKTVAEKDQVRCLVCEEVATDDTDFCPYCGDEGTDPDAQPEPAKTGKGKATQDEAAATETGLVAARRELDERVARIESLQKNLALGSYDMGLEIRAIHEGELWKARDRRSFKEFVETDLTVGRALAYKLLDVVKDFDRETFEKIGAKKLALVASITDETDRAAALDAAREGASSRDVRKRVEESRASGRSDVRTGAATGREPAKAPPKKAGEITLLAKVGGKAVNYPPRNPATGRPLAFAKDDSYFEVELSEDVRQRIAIKYDKERNIVGVSVAFVRVEE